MSRISVGGLPGMDTKISGEAYQVFWGRLEDQIFGQGVISSTCRDAGNSPTTSLRGGLILARLTSSGEFVAYSPTGANGAGSDLAIGVLPEGLSVLDASGTARDKAAPILLGGLLKVSALVNSSGQALQQLAKRFVFDDWLNSASSTPFDSGGYPARIMLASNYQATNAITLTAAMNGALLINDHSGALTVTLPSVFAGGQFEFYNAVDQNLIVNGPSSGVTKLNAASASGFTFSTSSQKIGAYARVIANPAADKWLVWHAGGVTIS